MFIVPTIYLRGRRAVNPAPDAQPALPSDPMALAHIMQAAGVELVHIVDLDAPTATGSLVHESIIKQYTTHFQLRCQLAAGHLRSADIIQRYLQTGIARVILGSLAYQQPDFAREVAQRFPRQIGIEISVRHQKVFIKGWTVAANKTALEYLERFRDLGITLAVYSDVDEHGALGATNFQNIRHFAEQAQMPVLHGCDLQSTAQLHELFYLEKFGVMGTILGKSWYEGRFDLGALVRLTKEREQSTETEDATVLPGD